MTYELNTGVLPIVNVGSYWGRQWLDDFNLESISELDDEIISLSVPIIERTLRNVLPSAAVTATGIYRPKFYNYSDDELEFTVSVDDNEYKALVDDIIANSSDEFNRFLRENYSSRSGFISSMAYDLDEFFDQEDWRQFCQVVMFNISKSEIQENNAEFDEELFYYVAENYDEYDYEDEDTEF